MNIKLIATKAFPYGRRQLKVGDRFEATDKDAKVLRVMKRAEDDHETTARTAAEDSTPAGERDLEPLLSRDLLAAGDAEAPTQGRARRRYNRRDMKAEVT